MQTITALSVPSQIVLYLLLFAMGLFAILIFGWQWMVLRGRSMQNPDGSTDDWHEQKILYGIAVADLLLACPACLLGIVLIFFSPRWGFYLLALVAFWFVWANTMTTATSLRFEQPKLNLSWWLTYPSEIIVGLAYIVWTVVHFDVIFSM